LSWFPITILAPADLSKSMTSAGLGP